MRLLRVIMLLPFSMIYGSLMAVRNVLYDLGILKSHRPQIPTVIVGNLSVGGTGKSPHVEHLIRELRSHYKLGIISRGYGRKTKGFIEVQRNSLSSEVGDEPLQIKQNFPEIPFAVCESRNKGIEGLFRSYPDLELILLDDAMQHRSVKGSFVIMLSLFNAPFFRDWVLPSGNLREFAFLGKQRGDACIYTKCPENLSVALKTKYANEFSKDKPSYFSTFEYDSWRLMSQKPSIELLEHVILVTGIAYPQPLIDHLEKSYSVEIMNFRDHHDFNAGDVAAIHRKFTNFEARKSAIVCTEKDAVKLELFKDVSENKEIPWYCIPIRVQVDKNEQLINQIQQYVKSYSRGR